MDKFAGEIITFINDKNRRKSSAILTFSGFIFSFAIWTIVDAVHNYVIFTTFAKWAPDTSATSTGVRGNKVEWAYDCCNFYII